MALDLGTEESQQIRPTRTFSWSLQTQAQEHNELRNPKAEL